MLTKKQRNLLIYIHERMKDGEVAPSFEEMKNALGLKSKSGIHRLIEALVERGYLERLPHRARALQVRKLPPGYQEGNISDLAARTTKAIDDTIAQARDMLLSVPLYGKIAAGTPIEAIRHEGQEIEIPPALLGRSGDFYALEVDGDSMIKASINDGDTVLIKRTNRAETGQIVVALVDQEEVTLKRFRRSGNKVLLEPENDDYEPRVLDPERVEVQGILAGLYRTYH